MKKILPHVFFVALVSIFSLFFVSQAQAICELSVSPASLQANTSSEITLSFQNTTSSSIRWIHIWSENESLLQINTVSLSGWDWNGATLSGGEITDGSIVNLTLQVTTAAVNQSSRIFIETSNEADGNNPVSCSDGALVEISQAIEQNPTISNISLAASSSSTTLSWETDLPTIGYVQYGLTNGYGSEIGNGVFTTSHSLTITDLSPETTYHYRILSFTQNTGSATTNDFTFTTGAVNTVITTTTTTQTVTQTVTNTRTLESTLTQIITDSTAPVITLNPVEKESFSEAPLITGRISDNRGIAKVEYSIDGGGWNSASLTEDVGEKKSEWEFVPSLSLDGTYEIAIRGIDVFGNRSTPKTISFVIDQLPPTVGGGVVMFHGMRLSAENNTISTWAEDTYEVLLHEIGGAETITLTLGEKDWNFTKVKGSKLWKADITLSPGTWTSSVKAVDGAGKETQRSWLQWEVHPKALLTRDSAQTEGEITLFWKEPSTGRFEPWHASEYNQEQSIQISKEKTGFGWVVPPGKYYWSLQTHGEKIVSPIFTVSKTSLMGGNWETQKPVWWSRFFPRKVSVQNVIPLSSPREDISLFKNKEKLEALLETKWMGQKRIILALSPSLPGSYEGLEQAQKWAQKEGADLTILGEQVTQEQLTAWLPKNISSSSSDYEGQWIESGEINLLPKAYLFDSYGKIVTIREGDLQ